MTPPEVNRLVAEFDEPRDVLAGFTTDEAEHLLRLYRRAYAAQHDKLSKSIDETLSILPRLLRIPARKIMFGR